MKLNTKTKNSCVGFASGSVVLCLVTLALFCPGSEGAHAADTTTSENITVGFDVKEYSSGTPGVTPIEQKGNFVVGFDVRPYIKLTQNPDDIEVEVNPEKDVQTASQATGFGVQTNSGSGFSVYVEADDALLKSADPSNEFAIEPILNNAVLDDFGANTWGYAVSDASDLSKITYRPIGNSPAYTKSTFSPDETKLKFTFGTKVSSDLPVDTYSTEVKISAVLSATEVARIASIENPSSTASDEGGEGEEATDITE